MFTVNSKILIILAHLDDEFAIAPLLKNLTKKNQNIKVIYCAERLNSDLKIQRKRRLENKSALNYLGINSKNIIYMNDEYYINDLEIHLSKSIIYNFLKNTFESFRFDTLLTLNLEGGHPDHDSLSLIIDKFSKSNKVKALFFPAYNYRKTLYIIPFSVLRPLEIQNKFFKKKRLNKFCWYHSLVLSFIYKSEWVAFYKIIPFIIIKLFFSNFIFYTERLQKDSIVWEKSLTYKRYKIKPDLLFPKGNTLEK